MPAQSFYGAGEIKNHKTEEALREAKGGNDSSCFEVLSEVSLQDQEGAGTKGEGAQQAE